MNMKRTNAAVRLRASGLLVVLALLLAWTGSASATPLISELFYDAEGSDDGLGFVELFGTPGTDLTGLTIEGINGSNGAVTHTIALSGLIPADGVFVLADEQSGGGTLVANFDLLANFDFQNGPDSVVLLDGLTVLDAVGYGAFGGGDTFAGEGSAAPDTPAGSSLARLFADLDTDDNSVDFVVLGSPTPGVVALQPVPEPGTAVLGALGLAILGRKRRAQLRVSRRPNGRAPAP